MTIYNSKDHLLLITCSFKSIHLHLHVQLHVHVHACSLSLSFHTFTFHFHVRLHVHACSLSHSLFLHSVTCHPALSRAHIYHVQLHVHVHAFFLSLLRANRESHIHEVSPPQLTLRLYTHITKIKMCNSSLQACTLAR